MPAAPLPPNETERLAALRAYEILDSLPEPGFDRITRMAAHLLEVPIALVSLVDEDRQWFKSCIGIDASETPRSHAFCAYAILAPEVLVVEDATRDSRFADNPLVTGEPGIRFYAGAPLISSSGHALGTLCTIDRVSRRASAEERALLTDLAALVVDELELRRANDARRQAGEKLERSNQELERFAYVASHDLKEPLRQVSSYCGLLQERLADSLDEESLRFLGFAVSGATRMEQLIEDLLAYSRVCHDELPKSRVGLEHCADQAVGLLRHAIDESGASVQWAELPELFFDESRLVQLLQNLIGNALKYRSERVPEVRLSAERVADGWQIAIADNGIGIEEKDRERIFGVFTRLRTRREQEGSGIGLSVCQRIVEQRGGRIRAEASESGGSRFVFTVPDPAPAPAEHVQEAK